jgi:hypothetical protein
MEKEERVTWPIVLDADDGMLEPEVLRECATVIGLKEEKLKFCWRPKSEETVVCYFYFGRYFGEEDFEANRCW